MTIWNILIYITKFTRSIRWLRTTYHFKTPDKVDDNFNRQAYNTARNIQIHRILLYVIELINDTQKCDLTNPPESQNHQNIMKTIRVLLTCSLRTHLEESKSRDFTLKKIKFWTIKELNTPFPKKKILNKCLWGIC